MIEFALFLLTIGISVANNTRHYFAIALGQEATNMGLQRLPSLILRLLIKYRAALGLLLLLTASYGLNLTKWTLFFNVDFILGSIAVWIVVCLYGVRWGVLAGFISGVCTYFLWNHPYSIITFTCEAWFVGTLFHRSRQNIVLLDGVFWCLIGMPLVWLFYVHFLHLGPLSARIILLKQPVNGIFNALIASLIITHLPVHRWCGRPRVISTLSFQQTVFNLFVAFVFFPCLWLIILGSQGVMDEIRSTAYTDLKSLSDFDVTEVRSWYQPRVQALNELAHLAAQKEVFDQAALQPYLELTQHMFPDITAFAIADVEGRPVFTSTVMFPSDLFTQPANRPFLKTSKDTQQPILSDPFANASPAHYVILNVPIVRGHQVRGFILGKISLERIEALLQANASEQDVTLTLLGRGQAVVATTASDRPFGQPFDRRADGDLFWLGDETYQWFSTKGSPLVLVRWANSLFVQESAIAPGLPWTLVVEKAAAPDVLHIQHIYARNLAIILFIVLLALLCSVVFSRWLVRPMKQLATMTTNLPEKLITGEPVKWVDSPVSEVALLVRNFRDMAAIVTQNFQEIQQALDYEALLKRITEHVRDSLDETQILQTVVQELGEGLGVIACDAAIYDDDQTHATICYEYSTVGESAKGKVVQLGAEFAAVHTTMLAGHDCLFSLNQPHPIRDEYQRATVLACPMLDYQSPLGDLWLYKPVGQIFKEGEIRLVRQIANQCAIAIRQARLYQAAQIQVKALEELNYLKDDFLSTVSHELRTPLTNIKMATKMLDLARSDEQRKRYLTILKTECDRESDLINDLLDLQRLTAGTQALNLEPIHLQEWVANIVETFQERTQNRQQNLQVQIPAEFPVILSDPACLSRIVTELLNNACKYTPPGEQITLSARAIADPTSTGCAEKCLEQTPLSLPRLSTLFALDVANTGVEIPPEEQSHIFEKFYRVPGIDRWKQGGTGLGLALVQKMTEHLGGTIIVKSQENQTCFTVKLPVHPNHDEETEAS